MRTLKNINLIHTLGATSTVGLLATACFIISPPVTEGASAESAEIPVSVTSEDYITLATTGAENATMTVTPDIGGSFIETPDIKLNVTTNNPTGYKLVMATTTGESALVNEASKDTIASIGGSVSKADFPLNHWGYNMTSSSIATENYNGIPSKYLTLDNRVVNAEEYNLKFAVRLDAAKTGTYTNMIVFSAVANPLDVVTLAGITNMQDMTSRICDDTPVDAARQLKDIRDNKLYWVAKLRDGNCWMTQNLAYDITQDRIDSGAINPTNTDVSEVWNASSAYPPRATIKNNTFNVGMNAVETYSWNLGEYVLLNPTVREECAAIPSGGDISNCNRLETYNGSQDAHYLVGNYYQWNAATAGTGGERITTDSTSPSIAPNSICPKGWRLPIVDTNYRNLLDIYNIGNNGKNSPYSLSPLYMLNAGLVDTRNSTYRYVGLYGDLMSRTAHAISDHSVSLSLRDQIGFNSSALKYLAYSVRCVAR